MYLYCRSSFSDFAAKYSKEERFRGVEKMRERESIFQDYVSDLRRKEKEDKASQKEKVSVKYFGNGLTRKCRWINVLGMTDLVLKRNQVTVSYQSASSIFGNSVYRKNI